MKGQNKEFRIKTFKSARLAVEGCISSQFQSANISQNPQGYKTSKTKTNPNQTKTKNKKTTIKTKQTKINKKLRKANPHY